MAKIKVTNLNDSGSGSLRQALANAAAADGEDKIKFAKKLSGGTITLSSRLYNSVGEVTVNGDIDGDGTPDITISGDTNNDGNGDVQFFLNTNFAVTTLNGLIFKDGYDSDFRANVIENTSNATLTITNSSIVNGKVFVSNGFGGTILSDGNLTLIDVQIEDAYLTQGPSSVGAAGVAASTGSTTSIERVSVTGNAADGTFAAVGIVNYGTLTGGIFAVDGTGDDGTGLFNRGAGTGAVITGIAGGSDPDTLNGTDGNDAILGFGGNDTLSGDNGDDTVYGGAGNDLIIGPRRAADGTIGNFGDGFDVLHGGPGNDTLRGGFYRDTIYGGTGNDVIQITSNERIDEIHGGPGIDTLDATGAVGRITVSEVNGELTVNGIGRSGPQPFSGVEVILGTGLSDYLNDSNSVVDLRFEGRGGDDALTTGSGDDTLKGGTGLDEIAGGPGKDQISGNEDADELRGNGGKDTLSGGQGDDEIEGNRGNDKIVGGAGNDTLTGGRGADDFVLKGDFGQDVITDFDTGDAKEDIDLSGVKRIKDFDDLKANHLTKQGNDVLITAGKNSVLVENVQKSDLDASDFIF